MEPGLFEWLGWYQNGLPRFMTPAELRDCGFNICTTHNPVWSYSKYNMQETTEQYYERCYQVTKEILKRHQAEGQQTKCSIKITYKIIRVSVIIVLLNCLLLIFIISS